MLTVAQALEFPVFRTSKVISGHRGVDNQIRWVHIVDIPDTEYEWRRQGVLLLTAGFGLHHSLERQHNLIPKLVSEGFAGIVLTVGRYFSEIPAIMRKQADELNFPIIQAPLDLLFIEVTEAILGHIVNYQYRVLQESNQINEQLTSLVLQGATLDDLAVTLARLLKRSVTIESPSFHILAAAQHGSVDAAREQSIRNGRTIPKVASRLLADGIYEKLLAQMGPIHVDPIPELNMMMERVVAPIIVDREIQGYIWIISGDNPLTDLDELAINQAATIAALILFKETAVHEVQEKIRGDFLDRLLNGDVEPLSTTETEGIPFRMDQPHLLFLLHGSLPSGTSHSNMMQNIGNWFANQDYDPLLVWRDDLLLVLLEGGDLNKGKEVAQSIVSALSHPAKQLLIGVGDVSAPVQKAPGDIRCAYEQAREAINIGMVMGQTEGVILFSELGLLHWLYHIPAEQWTGNAYLKHVDMLVEHDKKRSGTLLETLEVYLDHWGALSDSAQALNIHRNTLLNRLERIERLCTLDLRVPLHRLNLHVAIKSYRLQK
ncbi:MAG: hypothetical protein GY943_14060 [Chloroflexi bacterium]|nr:hypothetical protein [Chloroflexota bacterium]